MPKIKMRRRAVLGAGVGLAGAAVAAATTAWIAGSDNDVGSAGSAGVLRLGTGPQGGVFTAIGGELVKVLAERFPHTAVSEIRTGGAAENLTRLTDHTVELSFTYLDTVAGFGAAKVEDFTAVARLYDAWMHVIVRG